jgi:hypothetical protein
MSHEPRTFDQWTTWFQERHVGLARSAHYLADGGEPDADLVARLDAVRSRATTTKETTSW